MRREVNARLRPEEPEARRAEQALAATVRAHPRFARAGRIGLFAALGDEIPTRLLFEDARKAGRECLFPRCLDRGLLDFARVDAWSDLAPGNLGVLEPGAGRPSEPLTRFDLLFVPGLAFDVTGGRLGRGAGYYDRTLSNVRADMPFLCGLAYAFQVVDRVPMGTGDVRVDAVACETGWLDTRGEGGESRT